MIAAWRRGGFVDNFVTPALISLGAFPAFFTSLLAVYFLGLKWGWFPIQHAYDTGHRAGLQLDVHPERDRRHAQLPSLIIVAVFAGGWLLSMRNVMINTVEEDYVGMAHAKGLPDRRVMTMYAGSQRDPAAAHRASRRSSARRSAGSSSSSSSSAIRASA